MLTAPRSPRETFGLLAHLHDDLGALLARIEWRGVTSQQVGYAVLGHLPQELFYAAGEPPPAAEHFAALLLGPEFQAGILPNLLAAFPEKARRFFIHVPRSGGSSLGQTLGRHACLIPGNALAPEWGTGLAFLQSVAEICRRLPDHDTIHFSGHTALRLLIDQRLVRFGDQVWTSIRPPRDIMLSYINHILSVLASDPDLHRPDSRRWAARLRLTAPLPEWTPVNLPAAIARMMHDDVLLPRGTLCHFLGDGTAASAIEMLAALDVEAIDHAALDRWSAQRWPATTPPRINVSRPFVTWDDLGATVRRALLDRIRQDDLLYQAIAKARGDAISVTGMRIAQSGHGLPPVKRAAPRPPGRVARPILLDPTFVQVRADATSSWLGWIEPPLDYRTMETTLLLPFLRTRIRIRYAWSSFRLWERQRQNQPVS